MATYSFDPACAPESQVVFAPSRILFIGNVGFGDYGESDPRYLSDPANAELLLDVIARPGYEGVHFQNMRLYLRILSPAGVRFVEHGARNNYARDVLSESSDWLRIREDEVNLLSGAYNGKTYRIGIAGMPAGATLQFTAFAEAIDVRANTSSCVVTISELHEGDGIRGYLT